MNDSKYYHGNRNKCSKNHHSLLNSLICLGKNLSLFSAAYGKHNCYISFPQVTIIPRQRYTR